MADLENGFTRLANEILDYMAKVKFSPTQYRIIFVVWRYTYGFQRKSHNLSLAFISEATGCDFRNIQREIKKLIKMNIFIESDIKDKGRILSFNKNLDHWVINTDKKNVGEIDNGEIDNGEIDNGETDNGETDNGEIYKLPLGETHKETLGEIDNQERKKDNFKEIYIMSSEEKTLIDVLGKIKDYPLCREKEIDMYNRLTERHPTIDVIEVIKEWAISKLDKPLVKKDSPRSQINTWCNNAKKWNKNLKIGDSNDEKSRASPERNRNYRF